MSSGIVVLDAGAVERLATSQDARAGLSGVARRGWSFAVPTVVLAECLTGTARDARANRLIKQLGTVRTTESIARTAAELRHDVERIGRQRVPSGIDAIVAAHAIHLEAEAVLTSDVSDLRRLLANRPDIGVERA